MTAGFLCIRESKDADRLRGNREADRSPCFPYTDSTIPLHPRFQAPGHLVWLYSPVCIRPDRRPRRPVFLMVRLILFALHAV